MAVRDYQFITGPETSTLPTAGTPTAGSDVITVDYYEDQFTTKGVVLTATAASTPSPLTPSGYINGQVLTLDSNEAKGIKWANAPTGLKNYISLNADIEAGSTTGFSLGNVSIDATTKSPTGSPTFGSGASGNLSLTADTTNEIAGTCSLGYVSSAATTAGNFVSTDAFTMDLAGQASVMQCIIRYKALSGGSNANFSGTTSSSFGVAVYDVTNAAFIPVVGAFNFVQGTGVGTFSGTFQTSATGTSYRFLVYNANATAGAITMLFDNFFVGPQITAAGAPITTPIAYTPTFQGFGTPTAVGMFWRIIGDCIEISGRFTVGTTTAAEARIGLPTGYTSASTDKISAIRVAGTMTRTDNAALQVIALIEPSVTYLTIGFQSSTTGGQTKVLGSAINTGEVVSVYAMVPITGLSVTTAMSADSDTRVIRAQVGLTSNYSVGSNAVIKFDTVIKDSSASYSTSTGLYTAPVTGSYLVSVNAFADAAASLYLVKNGSGVVYLSNASATAYSSGSTQVDLVAGDTIGIYSDTARTIQGVSGGLYQSYLSINRISGPATIAATESVTLSAQDNAGTSLTTATDTLVPFATEIFDSHGAFASGIFTAPVSGKYLVSAALLITSGGGWAAGEEAHVEIYKNNTTNVGRGYNFSQATHSSYVPVSASAVVSLVAGDTIRIRAYQASGGTLTLTTTAGENYLSIYRVGN